VLEWNHWEWSNIEKWINLILMAFS
jgi:hypothetical protein